MHMAHANNLHRRGRNTLRGTSASCNIVLFTSSVEVSQRTVPFIIRLSVVMLKVQGAGLFCCTHSMKRCTDWCQRGVSIEAGWLCYQKVAISPKCPLSIQAAVEHLQQFTRYSTLKNVCQLFMLAIEKIIKVECSGSRKSPRIASNCQHCQKA